MQTQGVLPKACPRNRISRPHCSGRSCQPNLQLERTAGNFGTAVRRETSYLGRYNQHSRDVSTPRRDDARVSSLNIDRVLGNLCWQHRPGDVAPDQPRHNLATNRPRSARSCQRGFVVSTKVFFSKRQRTLTFSSPLPSVMLSGVGANATT
jgi:hypothetical protein